MRFVVREQPLRVTGEAKKDILLRFPGADSSMDGASMLFVELLLRVEGFATGAVPTLVPVDIEISVLLDPGDQGFHTRPVARLGRSDEVVVGDLEGAVEIVIAREQSVRELDR